MVNNKKVTQQEFMEGARGWDFSKKAGFISGSFEPFISPIDGKMIRNSKELSGHNRRHSVEQVGNEYINNNKD